MALFVAGGGRTQPAPTPPADASAELPDEPGAIWAPAAPTNFQPASRPDDRPIDCIVIHDIEGSAESAVRWFQNPRAQVSAHYVIGAAGRIWQQVRERDIGWHAGNREYNARSIGIEHEGFAYRPGYFEPALYEASARLVRAITRRYGIPRDREHILAHAEVPHPTDPSRRGGRSGHTDPGPYWDWDYYMALVRNDARVERLAAPGAIRPGEAVTITAVFFNAGDDAWPRVAGRRDDERQALGPVYLGAGPSRGPGAASPLYDRSWTSPRFVAPAEEPEDTPPGGTATFRFTIRGPRRWGVVAEELRLVKVPPAPRRPVPFGPRVSLRLRVEPWRFLREAGAPGFEAPGWRFLRRNGRTLAWSRASERRPPARWTVPLPTSGTWEIWARWLPEGGRSARVVYTVETGRGRTRVLLDPRRVAHRAPGWRSLGRFRFEGARPVAVVVLTADPADGRGSVVADTLRFVGPYPEPEGD